MPAKGDPKTCAIIGAAMQVHRELGCGLFFFCWQEGADEDEVGGAGLVEVDPRLAHIRFQFFYNQCKGTIISEG